MRTAWRITRFVLTMALVLSFAGGAMAVAHDRALTLESDSATLVASTYNVGTAFGGVVQDIYVERGSVVREGDELLRLQSATLEQAILTTRFNADGVGYTVEDNSTILFTAVAAGVVQDLNAGIGSFVPANEVIAVVAVTESVHLEAAFTLNARDYARLPVGGDLSVRLPDGSTVVGVVYDIQVDESEGSETEVLVRARNADVSVEGATLVGAPVTAELELQDDESLVSWTARQYAKLFSPGGFDR